MIKKADRNTVEPLPANTSAIKNIGKRTIKSKINASKKDDAAISKGKPNRLLIRYTYEREPIFAGRRSTNKFLIIVTNIR